MILIPLLGIAVIYVLAAHFRPALRRRFGYAPCAICAAVSLTWAGLLALGYSDPRVRTIAGILMGMSVAGLMYRAERLYAGRRIRNFWFVRLVIAIGGFYAVLFFLDANWDALTVTLIASVLAVVMATFLFQGTTHEEAEAEALKEGAPRSLIKKLDNCC